MPKAAKVTLPPRRPLNCESDPPLKILLPPWVETWGERSHPVYTCSDMGARTDRDRLPEALGHKAPYAK
eukprot:3440236-Prymnesium_polylepis.1